MITDINGLLLVDPQHEAQNVRPARPDGPHCDNAPEVVIVTRCAWCPEERLRLIAEQFADRTRPAHVVVSHTICPRCLEREKEVA